MKKKKINKEIDLGKIFLTDKALLKVENDEFGHSDYAELLLKLVNEQPTPFNIGVFGKWGVGKSSIVNLLKDKLKYDIKRKKIKFIEVKVWKYDEKISLTRKFIVNIAEGLGLSDDLNDLNKEIYYDREFETALLNFREIVSTIFNRKSIALWLMISSIALLLLFRILNIINVENPLANKIFKISEDSVLIPLIPSIFFWIIEIIKKARLKLKIGRYDSDEQFESKFIELVKKDNSKKIIFIDDLDRCSKEKVVKAIETIKTFLDVESCIFIIACDDEIIKKAINKSHELYDENGNTEGAEYLEKFFQYTLRIPPFLPPDMRKFILNLLKKNDSDLLKLNETLEDIIFITINNNVKSPRNAITALNEFSASYVLAHKRETSSSSRLHDRKITDNLTILAIVTSIRAHFPEFYSDMLKNSDLIFWLKDIFEGNQTQLNEKQLKICKKYFHILNENSATSGEENDDDISEKEVLLKSIDWYRPKHEEYRKLLQFIESIKDYLTIRDITPFLYIGVDTTSYLIGDESLQEFNDAMKNGIETRITKIIDEADESKIKHLFEHMLNWIAEKLEGIEQRKALQILSKLLSKCPKSQLHRASRVFYSKFYRRNISYVEYKKYSPEGILISANVLHGSNQKDLIRQSINFLGCPGNDINHDKLILQQIFNNEFLVNDKELIQKVKSFIDMRKKEATEKEESSELIDLAFVRIMIIEYEAHPNVIEKFFSGKIIAEVINCLIETEGQAEFNEDDYNEIVKVFEVLKKIVLDKDIHVLCEAYKSLIPTNKYYSNILDDIEIRLKDIPDEEYTSLSISLINELGNFNDDKSIRRSLDFCKFWFEKYDNVENEELLENLTEKLIELSQNEDLSISNISLTYFIYLNKYLEVKQENKILQNYITLIAPLNNLEKSRKLKEVITNRKESLSKENRTLLLIKIIKDLNTVDGLNNNECCSFWKTALDEYEGVFEDGELDVLVLPNNATNILHPNFPNATNDIRSVYCNIISINFKKISPPKQNEYFEVFKTFLSTNSKINSEYAINNIYKLKSYLKDTAFLISSVNLFIQQLNIDIEPVIKLMNINILFLCFDKLTSPQIDVMLEAFATNCSNDALGSVKVMLNNWEYFPNKYIFSSIKSLLPTRVFDDDKLLENILTNIESVFKEEDPNSFIAFMESDLRQTEEERNIYAKIIKRNSKHLKSDLKAVIKSERIVQIKSESDIDLCRNKMSTLIGIRESDYEKDTEINDMFFSLLNDNRNKKQLALDVFEYYFEDRYPFKRKGALEERFNNLMSELDSDYKNKLSHLASKYELRVKKSFWDSLFG